MGIKNAHQGGLLKTTKPNYGKNISEDVLNQDSKGKGMWKLLARHDSFSGQGQEPTGCCNTNGCSEGACGWSGMLDIPEECRGVYDRYLIKGATNCYENYCSRLDLYFAGGTECSGSCEQHEQSCCTVSFCGRMTTTCDRDCFQCGGTIPWIQGCNSSHKTACTACGFSWDTEIIARPFGYSCSNNMFTLKHQRVGGCEHNHYNFEGWGEICCCQDPRCLKGVWYSTQSDVIDVYGASVVEIYGYNSNFEKNNQMDLDGHKELGEVFATDLRKQNLFDHDTCNSKYCIDTKYKKQENR